MTQTTLQTHRVETTLDSDGRLVSCSLIGITGHAVKAIVLRWAAGDTDVIR